MQHHCSLAIGKVQVHPDTFSLDHAEHQKDNHGKTYPKEMGSKSSISKVAYGRKKTSFSI